MIKKRIQKYIAQFDYLSAELDFLRLQFADYNHRFKSDFADEIDRHFRQQQITTNHPSHDLQETKEPCLQCAGGILDDDNSVSGEQERDPMMSVLLDADNPTELSQEVFGNDEFTMILKRLFQKLILICHPDKQLDHNVTAFYPQVENAYRNRNLLQLLKVSKALGMNDIDIYFFLSKTQNFPSDVFSWMQININDIQKDIDAIKQTFAWVWCTSDDTAKPAIRSDFLKNFSAD